MRFKESVPAWSKRQWKLLSVFAVANLIGGIVYNIKGPFYPAEVHAVSVLINKCHCNYSVNWLSRSINRIFILQAEMKGVTSSQYGFVFGIFELTKVFVCPIFGKYVRHTIVTNSKIVLVIT